MVQKKQGGGSTATTDRAKAAVHPIRRRALALFLGADQPLSPKEIAVAIYGRMPTMSEMGKVSYHVKALLDLGMVEATGTTQVRGVVKHFYRPTPAAKMDETSLLDELAALVNAHAKRTKPNPRRALGDVADLLRTSGRSVVEVSA